MRYTVALNLLPHTALLDPAGKATHAGLVSMGFGQVQDVRIGKHILLTLEAGSETEAREQAIRAAAEFLCNRITEQYVVGEIRQLA